MARSFTPADLERWKLDPTTFLDECVVNPDTGRPFELLPFQRTFWKYSFLTLPSGRLRYPEQIVGCCKKSGKTGTAALHDLISVLVYGGRNAECYVLANDLEQSTGRVFQAIRRIVEASPLLRREAKIIQNKITFTTGATISAIACDAAGSAGANPCISSFDELWGYTSERSIRLWDEMVPSPARLFSCRFTSTYAGFEGESDLLYGLYQRGLKQPQVGPDLYAGDGILMFWSHEPQAPWQTQEWLHQMRSQLRPNAYLRMIENRFVSGEESFIDLESWDACVDPEIKPVISDRSLPVWVGCDASVKRDSTGIATVTWDLDKQEVRLVRHKIIQPSVDAPVDFEEDIENEIRLLASRFDVQQVLFDPYQMQASAQRLAKDGIFMREYPQTVPGLTASSQNLYEAIKGRNLRVYPDADIRLAISRAVAIEGPRGWRIAKDKQSHRIDIVIALAMAAFGAVQQGERFSEDWIPAPSMTIGSNGDIISGNAPSWMSDNPLKRDLGEEFDRNHVWRLS